MNNDDFKQIYLRYDSEQGSVLLESVIIAPFLVMFFMFCVDFLNYTKTQTYISQVARDATIFFAMVPGIPQANETVTNIYKDDGANECDQICEATSFEEPSCYCYHLATQERIYRSIISDSGTLNMDSLNIETRYNDPHKTVSVKIKVEKKLTFFWANKNVESKATLKKINL